MRLFILFYPWLELLSLIQLGVETSALTALLWVGIMVLLGIAMIRHVGIASMDRLRAAQKSGVLHQNLLIDDMAMVVAGLLFIVPGLLSDFFAIVVLIGPLRRMLASMLTSALNPMPETQDSQGEFCSSDRFGDDQKGSVSRAVLRRGERVEQVIIEGEFHELDTPTENDRTPKR